MRVTKATVVQSCAICERSLLMGEHAYRFSPNGVDYVDVCPLCQEVAVDHGWIREGLATSPVLQQPTRRRRQRSLLSALLGTQQATASEPVLSEPILRRLPDEEVALVEAAELFNASAFRRTVHGVAKALGPPQASIVELSGTNPDLVITFAWDITWYQYRVAPEASQPVRVAERGQDPDEIEERYTAWNASLDESGRLMPDIARL